MCNGWWIDQLPSESTVEQFPECDEDDIELRDLSVRDATVSVSDIVDRPAVVNLRVAGCDVAGFVARAGRAERLLVSAGRLRGRVPRR